MSVPSGTPGSDPSGLTSGDAATAEGADLLQVMPEGESGAGGPARTGSAEPTAPQSDDDQTTAATGDDDDATAEADARAAAEDEQDLASYPESVREHFKTLPPAQRRALYEHAETNARAQIEAANARTRELQQAEDARQAQVKTVLDSQGKFVGATAIDLTDPDGNVVPGPTYDELRDALSTRRGREGLWDTYGLREDTAEAVKVELDNRRAMLDGSAKLMDDAAWGTLAQHVKSALESVPGIDPEAIVAGANGPQQWLPRLVGAIDERHAREMAALKRDFENRDGAHVANAEGLRGRVIAAESRRLPTGGRTGGASTKSTRERLIEEAGGIEQFSERAARGEYVGVDLTK